MAFVLSMSKVCSVVGELVCRTPSPSKSEYGRCKNIFIIPARALSSLWVCGFVGGRVCRTLSPSKSATGFCKDAFIVLARAPSTGVFVGGRAGTVHPRSPNLHEVAAERALSMGMWLRWRMRVSYTFALQICTRALRGRIYNSSACTKYGYVASLAGVCV